MYLAPPNLSQGEEKEKFNRFNLVFSERKDNFYKSNYQLFFYKKAEFITNALKQKTIPVKRMVISVKIKIFYRVAGNKIRYCPKLTPLKLEPFLALMASKNLFAISAYPFGLG
jgi:hypothetical protein